MLISDIKEEVFTLKIRDYIDMTISITPSNFQIIGLNSLLKFLQACKERHVMVAKDISF